MKAQHRHELKTNLLADWIGQAPQWFETHLKIIIYVSAAAVIILGYYFYYRYQKTVVVRREQANLTGVLSQLPESRRMVARAQAGGEDRSYELLPVAQALENISSSAKQYQVAALALIKQAEIQRTEIQFRMGNVSAEDLTVAVNRAKENYNKALDILAHKPAPSLEAMAKLGLGLCEEDLGNFEQAAKLYNEVAAGPAFQGTTAAAAAQKRLALMDSFQKKITLKPAPASIQLQLAPQMEPSAEEINVGSP